MISPDSVPLPYNEGSLITDNQFYIMLPYQFEEERMPFTVKAGFVLHVFEGVGTSSDEQLC